jgi:hypothetical protein
LAKIGIIIETSKFLKKKVLQAVNLQHFGAFGVFILGTQTRYTTLQTKEVKSADFQYFTF